MSQAAIKVVPQLVLDNTLVETATKAVKNAFGNLFGVTPMAGVHSIQEDRRSQGDVSGILGMVQDKIEATLILTFQKETIIALMSKMYGQKITEIDSAVKQGVGELTNIIYASVKRELNEKGHRFKMSIPSVVIGAGHEIYNIHQGRSLILPFQVENDGAFFVEITLQGD